MKKTSKMIAGILAGTMMLSCVSVWAESTDNYSVTVNIIDKSIEFLVGSYGTAQVPETAERINVTIPDYKSGQKGQKIAEFTVTGNEYVRLKFDMIDGGTGKETCDLILTETIKENGKTIETVAGTIENLQLKSMVSMYGLKPDKEYSITVQSKTKSGNASFLFWTNDELKVKFDLQPSDDGVNNLVEFVIPNQTIGIDNSELVSTSKWDENFETLEEYEIFVGYDDGDAKPYNVITRAETAKALCAALGINPESTTEQHFSDVDSSHWAYRYINALADMKIVAGTGNNLFEPDREATINEVVKMLVCAIGYAPQADMNGGYPDGYIITANNIGLTKNLEQALTREYCQRYIAFTLFYNALDVPFLVQTGFDNGSAEFVVADGEDVRDYITMRYKITGKRNEG